MMNRRFETNSSDIIEIRDTFGKIVTLLRDTDLTPQRVDACLDRLAAIIVYVPPRNPNQRQKVRMMEAGKMIKCALIVFFRGAISALQGPGRRSHLQVPEGAGRLLL